MYLLTNTLIGGFYLILLFALCFCVVAGIKAVRIELKKRRSAEKPKDPPPEAKNTSPSPSPPKPREKKVYYIVEKKRTKRPKEQLGKPKRIEFRDQS